MASRKQAVLLIHGIGNQQPMQTLRSFVKTVWSDHTEIHNEYAGTGIWSKPDTVSKSFELRVLTTPKNSGDVRTDFYEFYWAHLMRGTGYGHVVGWVKSLLFRSPDTVSPGLKGAYFVLWGVLLAIIGLWVNYARHVESSEDAATVFGSPFFWTVFSTLASVILLPLVGFVMKDIIGDAARYLRPAAQNIQRRHEIRAEGVNLLKALHDRNYERIIVVGHSLGSVVGYDILTYAFPEYNVPGRAKKEADENLKVLEKMAQDASEGKMMDTETLQTAQRAYFEELKDIGGNWRVTDFITMGCPLAHADVLLATDRNDLEDKKKLRELPACLPELEQKIRTTDPENRRFTYGPEPKKTNRVAVAIPHHAAVFAPTRWTNLYFPARLILFGDLVGGPVRRLFGSGVHDIPVGTDHLFGFLSHTHYWRRTGWKPSPGSCKKEAVATLREILDLTDSRPKTNQC